MASNKHGVVHKDIAKLVALAARQGWRVVSGGAHSRLVSSGGASITIPGTPGDQRTVTHFRSQLRRAGVLVIKKRRNK